MKENGEGSKKTEEESGGGRVRYYVGILFVLAANVLTVVSNYFVKDYQTAAADIILFKGVLQIPLFGGIIWWGQRKRSRSLEITNGEANKNEKSLDVLPPKHVDKVGCVGYAFFGGVRYACLYSAVLFMPMADFIVICATTPIFSYIFSRIFLKSKLTAVKSVLCVVVVIGVVLVVKPPLLFPPTSSTQSVQNITSSNTLSEISSNTTTISLNSTTSQFNCRLGKSDGGSSASSKFTSDYWIGLAFGFGFAVSSSMCNVLPCFSKTVAVNVFMFWAGWGSVAVAFLLPPVVGLCMKTVYYASIIGWMDWVAVVGLAAVALMCNQLLIIATLWSSPTVMSMMRRSEIVLVMIIDMTRQKFPDAFGSVGFGLVLLSCLGMTFSNNIQTYINSVIQRLFKQPSDDAQRSQEQQI